MHAIEGMFVSLGFIFAAVAFWLLRMKIRRDIDKMDDTKPEWYDD